MKKTENKKFRSWALGTLLLVPIIALILFKPLPFLFYRGEALPYLGFLGKALYILLLASLLCLFRLCVGPTGADRIAAMDIIGILIIGFCAVLSIPTGRSWYIDIGIAWAIQSFISTLALAKYLEGKGFDE